MVVVAADIDAVMRRSKRRRPSASPKVPEEDIRQRIAASMARRAAKQRFTCPACGATLGRHVALPRHMGTCCPDIVDMSTLQKVCWLHTMLCLAVFVDQAIMIQGVL